MQHLKITQPQSGITRIFVDGHELHEVTGLRLDFPVGELPIVTITVLVDKDFEFTGPANVVIQGVKVK